MLSPSAAKRRRATARDVKRINRSVVIHHLLIDGEMNRQELSRRSGLSPATMSNIVGELLREGIAVELRLDESRGGRPSAVFGINTELGRCVGISVTETFVLLELFDAALHSLEGLDIPLDPDENRPGYIVSRILGGVSSLLGRSATPVSRVLGIGVSMPGIVERSEGVAVFAPNWNWHHVPLLEMLRAHLPVPIYVDSCLKFFVIAEAWFGMGRGLDDIITAGIGTGVGAGIILNGTLLRGTTNSAGEWGHTTIVMGGRECSCGNRGCVEAYVGAPGIMQTLREIDSGSVLLGLDQVEFVRAIAQAAREGESAARETLAATARYLGVGLANLVNLLNPQLIVLTGWIGIELGPLMLDELRRTVAEHAMEPPHKASKIAIGQLGSHAATMGAATLALERWLANT